MPNRDPEFLRESPVGFERRVVRRDAAILCRHLPQDGEAAVFERFAQHVDRSCVRAASEGQARDDAVRSGFPPAPEPWAARDADDVSPLHDLERPLHHFLVRRRRPRRAAGRLARAEHLGPEAPRFRNRIVGHREGVPRRSPGRGPPYWKKSRVLRRQVLADEDEGAGRGHRAGEEVAWPRDDSVGWTTVRWSVRVAQGRRDGCPLRGAGGRSCTCDGGVRRQGWPPPAPRDGAA